MNKAGRILSIDPPNAIPGGEVLIECEGLQFEDFDSFGCFFDGRRARVVGASSERVIAIVPGSLKKQLVDVYIENQGARSEPEKIIVGTKLTDDVHLVANPAIDPKDDSIILTRSGSRNQQLPVTLLRLESDGYLDELPAEIMNPTGLAFDSHGKLFVSNRADGEVCQINGGREVIPVATDLGVATGIAFDSEGVMYVGDRGGTVFKVSGLGDVETWALLEPSVSAYHMAFGNDGKLYVTAPGLCSHDSVYRIDEDGLDEVFFKGLGRPQGLAFDTDGDLFVAACYKGRHGIIKIPAGKDEAELVVSGNGIVGLCFTRQGEMIVATADSIYSLPLETYGTLLD
ncbi:MAG: gluconolaconase [Pyrinomonadaceae bacterium]|nr:gluconolaconase [Pyrinomonadaceae bacterium]